MKFQIKNRWSGAVQFECELSTEAEGWSFTAQLGFAVKQAYLVGASLVGASLVGASLVGASLDGASLVGASLVGARLDGASLDGARLVGASLVGASLVGASLVGARLDGAYLIDAGHRTDGYRFFASVKDRQLTIHAGCRAFSVAKARDHWTKTRGGTQLGDESLTMVDHLERIARIRGMID